MRRALLASVALALSLSTALALRAAEKPTASKTLAVADDARFAPPKDLDGYFPFTPPATKEAWAKRSEAVRTQTLVSQGLWPLPTQAWQRVELAKTLPWKSPILYCFREISVN